MSQEAQTEPEPAELVQSRKHEAPVEVTDRGGGLYFEQVGQESLL